MNALEILQKHGLEDNKTHTCRTEIPSESSDRVYIVSKRKTTGTWECSCPAWKFRRTCKHVNELVPVLEEAYSKKHLG